MTKVLSQEEPKREITQKEREAAQAMAAKQESVLKGLLARIPSKDRAKFEAKMAEVKKNIKNKNTLKALEDCGL
jgi:hypothetical protein